MAYRYPGTRQGVQQLRREMDRLVSGFLNTAADAGWPMTRSSQPAVNIWETPEAVHVELEVPGVKQDQLDISVVGNELALRIERPETAETGVTWHRRERPVGSFARVLRLPSDVDTNRVGAELRQGVLTISLPKVEAARPRKIQVSTGQ